MIAEAYKALINELIILTQANKLTWQPGDLPNSANVDFQGRKFIIDKYYTRFEKERNTCVGLTIFNGENLLDELVTCEIDQTDIEEFQLLNVLYTAVESQIEYIRSRQLIPILTDITKDLRSFAK